MTKVKVALHHGMGTVWVDATVEDEPYVDDPAGGPPLIRATLENGTIVYKRLEEVRAR